MPPSVFAAVLLGAALHATWNAIVKGGTDPLLSTVFVAAGSGAVALLALPFLPLPAPASWPFIACSALVQVVYFALVAGTYRRADMSLAYPLMRGTAPVIVAAVGAVWLGERLSPGALAGIALVCSGVLGMALAARRRASRAGMALALANAGVIATYTLIDGAGVRLSGAPVAYAMWLFLLNALPLVGWALVARGPALRRYARGNLRNGLIGGVGNLGSYGLALWAMTGAPVAVVAALRETSIVFAIAIAGLFLGERITGGRMAAAALIALGAVGLRLA